MSLRAIDCQGFAGAFTLGTVQAGFELVGKREHAGAFGVPLLEANRALLGDAWQTEAGPASTWTPRRVELVFGNPPCSGFSTLSSNIGGVGEDGNRVRIDKRGVNSDINSCMWDLVRYAAACKADMVIFESVQAAGKMGMPLMHALHEELEALTGKKYTLTHVFHNCLSVGGACRRPRYFFVASRVPFAIDPPIINSIPTLRQLWADLANLPLKAEAQKYRSKPKSPHALVLRSPSGKVAGQAIYDTKRGRRMAAMAEVLGDRWVGGMTSGEAFHLLSPDELAALPDVWRKPDGKFCHADSMLDNMYGPRRWRPDGTGGVLTGNGFNGEIVHPWLPRHITYREGARLLGFPDDWSVQPAIDAGSKGSFWMGKGIPVDSGRWVAGWARAALERRPGAWLGDKVGEREYIIDVTHDHKAIVDERTGELRDARSNDLKKKMAARILRKEVCIEQEAV